MLGLRCCCRLSLVVASRGYSSLWCTGFSLWWLLLLRSTSSRRTGSVAVAHGPNCSAACGIFPDQGSNPCPLHWQADSQPLRHQGSPKIPELLLIMCAILTPLYHLIKKVHKSGQRATCLFFTVERHQTFKRKFSCLRNYYLTLNLRNTNFLYFFLWEICKHDAIH